MPYRQNIKKLGRWTRGMRITQALEATRGRRQASFMAARGLNAAKRGLQLEAGEWKAIDTTCTGVLDTTGAVTLVNGCARGDDINERTGRKITMRSIQLKFEAVVTATTGIDNTCRVMLVYDKQTNGAAPTIANILATSNPAALRNLENRSRFVCLFDRFFHLNDADESGSRRSFQFYRKCRLPVTFNNGDAGTVADITTGSLYLLTLGSVVAGNTAGQISGYCRVRYEDK